MTQGIAISSITTWTADNTLVAAALIASSEHNTHRGNVRTDAANKLLAIQDLETSSAGTAAPTDKPIGKLWFDSTNLTLQQYEVASGALREVSTSAFQNLTGSVTLVARSPETILSTPTAAYTQTLPTTSVTRGKKFTFKNLSATAGRNITINASGGTLVWVVCPGNECTMIALQDTPTTNAHWALLNRGWPIFARVHKSADQANVAESTAVLVTFDTVLNDPASMMSANTLVFPVPGPP